MTLPMPLRQVNGLAILLFSKGVRPIEYLLRREGCGSKDCDSNDEILRCDIGR